MNNNNNNSKVVNTQILCLEKFVFFLPPEYEMIIIKYKNTHSYFTSRDIQILFISCFRTFFILIIVFFFF